MQTVSPSLSAHACLGGISSHAPAPAGTLFSLVAPQTNTQNIRSRRTTCGETVLKPLKGSAALTSTGKGRRGAPRGWARLQNHGRRLHGLPGSVPFSSNPGPRPSPALSCLDSGHAAASLACSPSLFSVRGRRFPDKCLIPPLLRRPGRKRMRRQKARNDQSPLWSLTREASGECLPTWQPRQPPSQDLGAGGCHPVFGRERRGRLLVKLPQQLGEPRDGQGVTFTRRALGLLHPKPLRP